MNRATIDRLYAKQITILPGSKVEFEDCTSGEKHTVTLSESVTVQSTKNQIINVEADDGEEEERND